MALTKQRWFLDVQLVDRGNRSTVRRFDLVATDTAWDASAVNTAVVAVLANITASTECKIKSYRMGVHYLETSFTLPTSAEAELEQHALITTQIKGKPNKSAVIDIPGPKQTLFLGTSGPEADEVDFGGGEPALGYLGMFDSAGENLAYLSDGEQCDQTIRRGRKTHSKSQKG